MADFEFAIAVKDEEDLASGHKRKKQGDIIAVKPAPWEWGRKELDEYLIVPVTGLTKAEAHSLCQPYYEGGVKQEDIPPLDPTAEKPPAPVKIVGKRRYSVPLDVIKTGWCPDMKTADVADVTKVYQPLKDTNVKIDFADKVAICKDNHTGTFLFAATKIAEV
jgi:hypothetical protein